MKRLALVLALLALHPAAGLAESALGGARLKEVMAAARKGDAEAQMELATRYALGAGGVKKNDKLAAEWYRKAGEQGVVAAAHQLGLRYERGQGVDKDLHQAARWYDKATELGHLDSLLSLARLLLQGGNGAPYDPVRAAALLKKAADGGVTRAQVMLGRLHQRGEGVPQDVRRAEKLFRNAAELGDPAGRTALAQMLRAGNGIDKNVAEGMKWLEAAAQQGHAPALYHLAMAHFNGVDAALDLPKAILLMTQSADQGYPDALLALARFHRLGQGVRADLGRALMYALLARDLGSKQAAEEVDRLQQTATKAQMAEAQRQANEWRALRGL